MLVGVQRATRNLRMKHLSLRTFIFPFAGNPNYRCMGLLFCIALFADPVTSLGQGFATVRGTIQGLDGEPVPGGKVVAMNMHTKRYRLEHPDPQGSYLMADVAPGSYTLVACDNGSYEVAKPIGVQLSSGDDRTVSFQ